MKSLKQSTKGSSSSTAVAAVGGGHRKSRWEPEQKPPSDRRPNSASNSQPSKSKDSDVDPSAASPAVGLPKDQPPPAASSLPGAVTQPLATGPPIPLPDIPPPPSYGFHNLERRNIVLIDGSVRSYFALPPDEPAADKFAYGGRPGFSHGPEPGFPPRGGRLSPEDFRGAPLPPYARGGPEPGQEFWARVDGPRVPAEGESSWLKRKHADEGELAWHRQRMLQYGKMNGGIASASGGGLVDYIGRSGSPNRPEYQDDMRLSKTIKLGGDGHDDLRPPRGLLDDASPAVLKVDPKALKSAFLRLSKSLNESLHQRMDYLENGKNGPLKCIVCDRASKDFASVHDLLMHAYNCRHKNLHVDHLGLHKALCVLMGWNYSMSPENSKGYQILSAEVARGNIEDLIIWPPVVIIHNAIVGRTEDGKINREMDNRLKELGFSGGKSRAIYGKEGHTGVLVVKFASTQYGLEEAEKLARHFRIDDRGRDCWLRMQSSKSDEDYQNPALVKADEKSADLSKRILYGYLGTASDLDKLDFDMRRKTVIKSKRELDLSD